MMTSPNQPPKLRITFENHGRTNITELPFDAGLVEIMQSFCNLLAANGWTRKNIAELFEPEGDSNNNPFDWEVS